MDFDNIEEKRNYNIQQRLYYQNRQQLNHVFQIKKQAPFSQTRNAFIYSQQQVTPITADDEVKFQYPKDNTRKDVIKMKKQFTRDLCQKYVKNQYGEKKTYASKFWMDFIILLRNKIQDLQYVQQLLSEQLNEAKKFNQIIQITEITFKLQQNQISQQKMQNELEAYLLKYKEAQLPDSEALNQFSTIIDKIEVQTAEHIKKMLIKAKQQREHEAYSEIYRNSILSFSVVKK